MQPNRKTAFVSQSNYIPWKGYFDQIARADRFVLYDGVQYTRRDWRNRNRVKTANGVTWLTIPVEAKGKFDQRIRDTKVSNSRWVEEHLTTLRHAYGRTPHFESTLSRLEPVYERARKESFLSSINRIFLEAICGWLKIDTEFRSDEEFSVEGDPSERLASICESLGADRYLTGPRAADYLDRSPFESRGIEVEFFDVTNYPIYEQPHGEFVHEVSILDLLFCAGDDARRYLKVSDA